MSPKTFRLCLWAITLAILPTLFLLGAVTR
jgi:hypothetical protein